MLIKLKMCKKLKEEEKKRKSCTSCAVEKHLNSYADVKAP
jgi:hypothetical protein